MRPSTVLTIYYLTTLVVGLVLSACVTLLAGAGDIGARGAAIMTLCWNVLFMMTLPLVLDWSERRYFKARFLQLEEVADKNPELAAILSEQCQRFSLTKLKLAIVDSPADDLFSYGLLGSNPRLVVSGKFFQSPEKNRYIATIEAELTRFTSQDNTTVFLLFTVLQVVIEQVGLCILGA